MRSYRITIKKNIELKASTIEDAARVINTELNLNLVTKYMVANWVNKNRIKSKKYDFITITTSG